MWDPRSFALSPEFCGARRNRTCLLHSCLLCRMGEVCVKEMAACGCYLRRRACGRAGVCVCVTLVTEDLGLAGMNVSDAAGGCTAL